MYNYTIAFAAPLIFKSICKYEDFFNCDVYRILNNRETFEEWKPAISSYINEDKKQGVFLVLVTLLGNEEGGFANANGKRYDFATRVFDILAAVEEDPVTGITTHAHHYRKVNMLLS